MSRDRFTEKDENGKWMTEMLPHERRNYYIHRDSTDAIDKDYLYGPAIERLAAYENLIFSPEVLQAIIKERKKMKESDIALATWIEALKTYDPTTFTFTRALNAFGDLRVGSMAPGVERILKSGNRTIVFWKDGTKTIVKRAEDEADNDYAAFTAALGIKLYGSNSALKRVVSKVQVQKPKKGAE